MCPEVLLTVVALCVGAVGDTFATLGGLLPASFDQLIRAASASCEALPLEPLITRSLNTATSELLSTDIVEFRNVSRRKHRVITAHEEISIEPSTLVLYLPGWWNTPTDESSTAIVESLLTKNEVVFVLDTRLSFCRGYIYAVTRVNPVSRLLFNFIKRLHNRGFDISSIHLIGFSLGAHVAGMTGKLVQRRLKKKLGRITALDPAKPCFTKTEHKLGKSDAEFVQVIHSSSGLLGIEQPIGHTDVYVNGVGGKQPECMDRSISFECDHAQAWRLFSASAMNEKSLMGKKCRNWNDLVQDNCNGEETVLGYSCSAKSSGMFLYKSEIREKRQESVLGILNPFRFFTG